MVGRFKRGGFRGNSGGSSSKDGFTKKRSTEESDDASRLNKRSKGEDDEEAEPSPLVPKLQVDEENNPFVAINHSGKRRVTISDFKGATLVSIREYWVNDGGELKPGKKGISLSIEQYNALITAAPLLESVLSKRNVRIARPDYEANPNAAETMIEEEGALQHTAKVDNDDEREN